MIVDGGRKCYLKGIVIYNIEKITDEEFDAMEKDYDPIEAPPGPYKIQPHNQGRFSKLNDIYWKVYIFPGPSGRILWMCGAPAMGKSSTAQLLARHHGYVFSIMTNLC